MEEKNKGHAKGPNDTLDEKILETIAGGNAEFSAQCSCGITFKDVQEFRNHMLEYHVSEDMINQKWPS